MTALERLLQNLPWDGHDGGVWLASVSRRSTLQVGGARDGLFWRAELRDAAGFCKSLLNVDAFIPFVPQHATIHSCRPRSPAIKPRPKKMFTILLAADISPANLSASTAVPSTLPRVLQAIAPAPKQTHAIRPALCPLAFASINMQADVAMKPNIATVGTFSHAHRSSSSDRISRYSASI